MVERVFSGLDATGVVAVNSIDYVTTMLSYLETGSVTVPLRTRDDAERIKTTGVTKIHRTSRQTGWLEFPFCSRGGQTPAQVSFTSGTEGLPKAVLLSHKNLHDVVVRITGAMEITHEIREYVGVPVYHSFGYGRCRAVLNAGGSCFIPEYGFNLGEIRRMLQSGEINAISAVPSLWRLFLAERHFFGKELQSVRWVEIGSQYLSADEKLLLRKTFPNAKIVQHYGLTEASRATLLRIHDEPPENLESVGRAEGHVRVRISSRGRIEVRGPNIALGILEDDNYRKLGRDDWLETGDLGHMDNGLLYFDGRADDIINCGGIKVQPDLIEDFLRQSVSDVGDFAVVRRTDPVLGEGITLVLTADQTLKVDSLLDALFTYLKGLGIGAKSAVEVQDMEKIPRTPTGKVQRKELLAALSRHGGEKPKKICQPSSSSDTFQLLLQPLFSDRQIDRSQTFDALGGDSLLHIQLSLALDRALGEAPRNWEHTPFGDLIDQVEAESDLDNFAASARTIPPLPKGDRNMNPEDISLRALIREDYRTNDASLFHQGFLMLLIHRFGNFRMDIKWKLLRAPLSLIYRMLNKLAQLFFGMKLDYTVKVGRRVKLEHFGGMILGAREIGNDVILRQNTTLGIRSVDDVQAKPVIGDFVDIGAGAVIVGDIHIGENSIIGANSVVYANVPPNSVVVGVPGRVIGTNPRHNPSPLKANEGLSKDD